MGAWFTDVDAWFLNLETRSPNRPRSVLLAARPPPRQTPATTPSVPHPGSRGVPFCPGICVALMSISPSRQQKTARDRSWTGGRFRFSCLTVCFRPLYTSRKNAFPFYLFSLLPSIKNPETLLLLAAEGDFSRCGKKYLINSWIRLRFSLRLIENMQRLDGRKPLGFPDAGRRDE